MSLFVADKKKTPKYFKLIKIGIFFKKIQYDILFILIEFLYYYDVRLYIL